MKRSAKIWLITAAALVTGGAIVFVGAMAFSNWDIGGLWTSRFVTETYEAKGAFDSVHIEADTDDIVFRPSDSGKCEVVCYEHEKIRHSVAVTDKTLEIKSTDTRPWYERIGLFSLNTPKITVLLPEKTYSSLTISSPTGDVEIPSGFTFGSIDITGATGSVECAASSEGLTKINMSTGDIRITGVSAGEMELSVSTGEITLESVECRGDITAGVSTGKLYVNDARCRNFSSEGSTGGAELKNVAASQAMTLRRSTGDVELNACDAGGLSLKTTTGDVTGTLLSEKVFITDTSTGDVSVPKTASGGKCEISTTTGDIRIDIVDK